jgi:hypothetical protein
MIGANTSFSFSLRPLHPQRLKSSQTAEGAEDAEDSFMFLLPSEPLGG